MSPASSLSTFPLIWSSSGAMIKPSNSSSSSVGSAFSVCEDGFDGEAASFDGVVVGAPLVDSETFPSPASSARESIIRVRNEDLFERPFNSRSLTSSSHLRSASSFRLYAAVTNFSFPSYIASSFCRSFSKFLSIASRRAVALFIYDIHLAFSLISSLLQNCNILALSLTNSQR